MNPHPSTIAERTKEIREGVEKCLIDGMPYGTLQNQKDIAKVVKCHYRSVRKVLQRLNLIGRQARNLGPDPRTVRASLRTHKQMGTIPKPFPIPSLYGEATVDDLRAAVTPQAAEEAVRKVALDARDPVQRLELLNALATNAKGDVPYAVQSAALTKISDESKSAGEGFGPPAPTTAGEETDRVFAVLVSALPQCVDAAWERLGKHRIGQAAKLAILQEEKVGADTQPPAESESENAKAPQVEPTEDSGGDATSGSGVE